MGWDGVDRRKKKRYGIKNSIVRYRKSALPIFGANSDPLLLLNVSQTGAHFMTREPLEEDQRISLKIEAPALPTAVTVKARVAWVRASEQAKEMYRVGVEFVGMSGGARDTLREMLDGAVLDNVEVSTRVYVKELEKL